MTVRGWRPTFAGDFPTLGWQILDHASAHFPSPDDADRPFVFTDEQARFVLRAYELDPATGDRLVRRAHLEEAKGWGKSPLAAVIAGEEFVGPVCFDGWDAKGQPVGVPWGTGGRRPPWIQIAAVSEDQTDNTYLVLYEMLASHDGGVAAALGIDHGRTRCYLRGRAGRLEPVTASAGSREGQRLTFAVLDETHLWTPSSGGVGLARTIRRNLSKIDPPGWSCDTSNAPGLGSKSVAEGTTGTEAGVLHHATRPATEPQPDWSDERLLEQLRLVYRDAPWVPVARLLLEIRDPETDWSDSLRFYFNVRSAAHARLVDPRRWAELVRLLDLPDAGTRIALGFDGSLSKDATILRGAIRMRGTLPEAPEPVDGTAETPREGALIVHTFALGSWVRPKGEALKQWRLEHPEELDWQVPRGEVDAAVDAAFERYDVGLFEPDPPYWYSECETWRRRYGEERVKPLDTFQARLFSPAVDVWRTAVEAGTHTHDGDPVTTAHVNAARLRKVRLVDDDDDKRTRYMIVKGDDRAQIDGAIADVLAVHAATIMGDDPVPAPFVIMGRAR